VQDLTGQLAEQEAKYANEASLLRQLISRLEEREAQTKAYVDSIEKEWALIGDKAQRREDSLRDEVEHEKRRAEAAEDRVQELEKVMHRMDNGDLPIPVGGSISMPGTPGTPMRNGTPDVLSQGLYGLSPTVAMASRVQRGGKTFTEVYADYVRLQDELAKRNAEFDHMERTLGAVLAQIEERVRRIGSLLQLTY
jgi:nucleoprotein TPR